ncbi:MAG: hypothetical protein QOF21_1656 [Actinomycetota bacterium]|jgi:hypothetical protein
MMKLARLLFATLLLCAGLNALVGSSASAEQSAGPRFEAQSEYTVDRGEEILVYVRAIARDELGDCLLVTISPLPEGARFDPADGNIPPCPTAGNDWAHGWDQIFFFKSFIPGPHAIHMTASYGGVTKEFTVTIHVRRIATQVVADPAVATVAGTGVSTPLTVAARLTSGSAALAGRAIQFTKPAGALICTGTTNANGVASCDPLNSAIKSVPLGYVATFTGDGTYLPSSSRGSLVRIGNITLP